MIQHFFSLEYALAILSIPLSPRLLEDCLVWAYNPKGLFIVRSAYKVGLTLGPSNKSG